MTVKFTRASSPPTLQYKHLFRTLLFILWWFWWFYVFLCCLPFFFWRHFKCFEVLRSFQLLNVSSNDSSRSMAAVVTSLPVGEPTWCAKTRRGSPQTLIHMGNAWEHSFACPGGICRFIPCSVLILASDWLTTVRYGAVSHVWRHQREL